MGRVKPEKGHFYPIRLGLVEADEWHTIDHNKYYLQRIKLNDQNKFLFADLKNFYFLHRRFLISQLF